MAPSSFRNLHGSENVLCSRKTHPLSCARLEPACLSCTFFFFSARFFSYALWAVRSADLLDLSIHDRLGRRVSFILLWDIFQSRPNARNGLCSLYQRFDDYILFQEAKDPIRSIFDAWLHSLDRHDTALKSSHGILSTWNKNKIKKCVDSY